MQRIAYNVVGQGPPVLLVHGGLSNASLAWQELRDALSVDHRLIAVDRRGHGESRQLPGPYTISGDAADLLAVADELGLATFHIVGHSYGGLVALELCRRAPRRLDSLHLIEPPYLSLLPADADVAALDAEGRRIRKAAGEPERVAFAFLTMVAGKRFAERVRAGAVWPHLVQEARRFVLETYAGDYSPQAWRDVPPSVPLQLYTGGLSHPALRAIAHALGARWPGSQLVDIPNAYHDVQRRTADFAAALRRLTVQIDAD